jgi:short-subunit dehydrogenase
MELRGARVLITGASGGLGMALATELHRAGAIPVLSGRREPALAQLAAVLDGAEYLVADWHSTQGRRLLVERVLAREQPVDAVVLNAGVNHFGAFADQDPEALQSLLQTDLVAPMLLAHGMLPGLLRRPRAALLFVGSTFARLGHPGFAGYVAAKHGLHGLAKALRREYAGTALAILEVHPRAMATPMSTPEIDAVNRLQSAAVDPPARIAAQIVASLRGDRARWQAGWPERLFVLLDQRWPGLLDRVLGGRWPQLRDAALLSARSQRSNARRVSATSPLAHVEK